MDYLVIIENAGNNYSAYLPDVPGCIATGKTIEEVKVSISKALEMHLKGLEEDGESLPEPITKAEYIKI